MAVWTAIALGVVMLIPAAPGQSEGGSGGAGSGGGNGSGAAVVGDLPWRPFLDPIDLHNSWYWLLIPMAFGISVVYKAVRMQTLDRYWLQVLNLTVQIVFGMVLLGAATYLVVMVFAPYVARY